MDSWNNHGIFPTKVYEIIISYISDRHNVSSVSKLFYDIAGNIEKFKKKLSVKRDEESKVK